MNVKKFTAATSREALRKVRDALGPDAVILSNRPSDGVVEILALANDDASHLARNEPSLLAPAMQRVGRPFTFLARAVRFLRASAQQPAVGLKAS